MSEIITLPSGATVEWRDPNTVLYGERKRLFQARAKAIKEDDPEAPWITGEMIIALLVESWTVKDERGKDLRLPRNDLKVLEELSGDDMNALADRANADSSTVLGTKMEKTKENLKDADSPLDESTDSKDSSEESQETNA